MKIYQHHKKTYIQIGRHQFTLVEIMVALGMLMLMMTFLFQFVLGSQRLWNATEHQGQLFDDGQIVMDIVGDDLRNIAFSTEIGQSRPFYRREYSGSSTINVESMNVTDAKVFLFFSYFNSDDDYDSSTHYRIGCFPIMYVYVPEQVIGSGDSESVKVGKARVSWSLYRIPLVRYETGIVSQPALNILWEPQAIDFSKSVSTNTDNNDNFSNYVGNGIEQVSVTREYLLMRNVSSFDILSSTSYSDTNFYKNNFIIKQPNAFHIQLGVFSRNSIKDDEWESTDSGSDERKDLIRDNGRLFTKSIRVD